MRSRLQLTFGFLLGIGAASLAQAGFSGNQVTAGWYYPDSGTVYEGPYTATVGAGTEFTFTSVGTTADLSDANIVIAFPDAICSTADGPDCFSWDAGSGFDGMRLLDTSGTIDAITNVTIDPATNFPGFDTSRISFDGDNIGVNFGSLIYDSTRSLSLDVTFASAVPEPESWGLLTIGLLLVVNIARRRDGSAKL